MSFDSFNREQCNTTVVTSVRAIKVAEVQIVVMLVVQGNLTACPVQEDGPAGFTTISDIHVVCAIRNGIKIDYICVR